MNKDLIELQRGCVATCVVVLENSYRELESGIVMDANIPNHIFYKNNLGNLIFKEKLESFAKNETLTYFVIKGIDEVSIESQNRFIGLVKDRELNGYILPSNVIIVFTVKSPENLQLISKDLYHFCVVAF